DDLLVANPRLPLVFRDVSLPPNTGAGEVGEGPADEVVVGVAALLPNLVAVLTGDQADGRSVDGEDGSHPPGVDLRVVRADREVVSLRLLSGRTAAARRANDHVLYDPAFE